MPDRRTPRSTYRLQLRPGFGFDEAAEIADYLAQLGVSHAYTSPYLQAAEGSTHGYDVVDHSRVSDELGGADAHQRFVERLADLGLGQVVDVVPNHMAIGSARNRWWWDVLENGPSSRFAGHFDVDWDPPEAKLRNRVLMPILGDHYGRVLEAGEIRLTWDPDDRFRIRYFDHELPVAPRSLASIVRGAARRCVTDAADHLAFIAHSLDRLPSADTVDKTVSEVRHRDKEVLYSQLGRLTGESTAAAEAVRAEVDAANADVDVLDDLLERQNYRLAFWRIAGQELDYRRFFDITTLAGLRIESPEVFADTHRLVLSWVAAGEVDGLRIDHPDGLRDPLAYLEMLRAAAPDQWIVVEKILEVGERLPDWPVDGTTGYDAAALITRLLHDERGIASVQAVYEELVGAEIELPAAVRAAKLAVLGGPLAADVSRVTEALVVVAEQHRRYRDFSRRDLRTAVVELAAAFDVYRTYIGPDAGRHSVEDSRALRRALEVAMAARPDLDVELLDFLVTVLRGVLDDGSADAIELRLRFQQLTGPVMAKGVEDTVVYDVVPLASLNEVGADQAHPTISPAEFHAEMERRAATLATSMVGLSTHDTKRSEDVRARLAVLSEVPGAWADLVRRWDDALAAHRGVVGPDVDWWPDRRMEMLLLQTLVGAHPISSERVVAYMEKASREAKRHTSWIDPVAPYDDALRGLVEAVCADPEVMAMVGELVDAVREPGRINSLAQKLICLTVPGVPDVYQGTEMWDLSLVDPDNRRPVDYRARRRTLESAASLSPEQRWEAADDGAPKIWTVHRALALRAAHPEWFGAGSSYVPLASEGGSDQHVVAFRRGDHVAVVVPRLPVGLAAAGGWDDTTVTLPDGPWWDELGEQVWPGGTIAVADLLGRFPVALLHTDVPADRGGGP